MAKVRSKRGAGRARGPRLPGDKPGEATRNALVRLTAVENLGTAYQALTELAAARAAAAADRVRERDRIDTRASYLINSLEAAGRIARPAPASASKALDRLEPLSDVRERAVREQRQALAALARRERREEGEFERHVAEAHDALLQRARHMLAHGGPGLAVTVRPVGRDRAILQIDRPTDDDAALLCMLLAGKVPTRYGFFGDDAVDDVKLGPARFYAEEGLSQAHFGDPEAEDAVSEGPGDFVPVRGFIPARLPNRAFPRFRLIHHGPVGEVEGRRASEPYTHLLLRDDAELFTGYLMRLKVEGKLKLSLEVG